MTSDGYLQSVLDKYHLSTSFVSRRSEILKQIEPVVRGWGNGCLLEIKPSGSFPKGTAINGSTDLDLFISLHNDTDGTLHELYDGLFAYLSSHGYKPQKRNAAIKIIENNMNVDLIPGKKRTGNTNYHSIWLNRQDSWAQTNIDMQINYVAQSSRVEEIKLSKIWRELHGLDFPSFYLELTVIDALYNKPVGDLANNFYAVLLYIRDNFMSARIQDPSNSNNIVSNVLSDSEKQLIINAAKSSLSESYWQQIVW